MLYPWLSVASKYGYLGVDLFFLISGFVIMMSASHGSVRSFVASRAARLYPAFWVCCTATFSVLAVSGQGSPVASYLANMTMVGLVAPVGLIDPSYWTLGYEIRFYAMVAVVMALGLLHRAEALLTAWLLICLVLAVYPIRYVNFLFIADYGAYFIGGSILHFVWAKGFTVARGVTVLGCCALAVYRGVDLAMTLQAREGVAFDAVTVSIVVLGCFLAMLLIAMKKTGALAAQKWLALGALTYPLYLLHSGIGFRAFELARGIFDPHVLLWSVTIGMIAAAGLVNRYVERPFARPLRVALQGILGRLGLWSQRRAQAVSTRTR